MVRTERVKGEKMSDQKKLEAIENQIWIEFGQLRPRKEMIEFSKKILSTLKQFDPEPIEVEIDDQNYVCFDYYGFETKQEALEWCELKGLKVKK